MAELSELSQELNWMIFRVKGITVLSRRNRKITKGLSKAIVELVLAKHKLLAELKKPETREHYYNSNKG